MQTFICSECGQELPLAQRFQFIEDFLCDLDVCISCATEHDDFVDPGSEDAEDS